MKFHISDVIDNIFLGTITHRGVGAIGWAHAVSAILYYYYLCIFNKVNAYA